MAKVRKATFDDIPALLAMGAAMHAESPRFRAMPYSEEKVYNLAVALLTQEGAGGILVAEADGIIVGMFSFVVSEQFFGPASYAADLVVYVKPEHRGGSAFLKLVRAFENWADELGVHEKLIGVSTMLNTKQTISAYEKLGYEFFGGLLRKV